MKQQKKIKRDEILESLRKLVLLPKDQLALKIKKDVEREDGFQKEEQDAILLLFSFQTLKQTILDLYENLSVDRQVLCLKSKKRLESSQTLADIAFYSLQISGLLKPGSSKDSVSKQIRDKVRVGFSACGPVYAKYSFIGLDFNRSRFTTSTKRRLFDIRPKVQPVYQGGLGYSDALESSTLNKDESDLLKDLLLLPAAILDDSVWTYYAGVAKELLTERFTEIARSKSCFDLVLQKKASIKMLTKDDLADNLLKIVKAEANGFEPYSADTFVEALAQLRKLAEDQEDLNILAIVSKTVMESFFLGS